MNDRGYRVGYAPDIYVGNAEKKGIRGVPPGPEGGKRISRELLEKENKLWRADALILPIPLRKAGDTDLLSETIAKHSDRIRKVYGGSFPKDWAKPLEEARDSGGGSHGKPEVAKKNAIATAEGAIAELMKLMPVNVEGAGLW